VTEPTEDERPRLGRRGRARYATTNADQRIARPLVIALVGVVAVAAIIFWPRGGGVRLGADDPVHVVRVDSPVASPTPKTTTVDVATVRRPLVPETPSRERTTERERPLTMTTPVKPAETVAPPPPAPEPAVPAAEPPPVVQPAAEGAYALQLSSFESESGAQALRDDLSAKGYPVHIRAASTATGAMVYRVWVGYFRNREDATAYAGAHQDALAGATAVHR
jgi:cell division septation protein DedD